MGKKNTKQPKELGMNQTVVIIARTSPS